MKTKSRKGFAWLLTLCMAFSLFPATVFAAGPYGGIVVDGGTLDTDYSWNDTDKVLTILSSTPLTLSGSGEGVHILVEGETEGNLTLNGIEIDNTAEDCGQPIVLKDTATLNLNLAENSTNTLSTHFVYSETNSDSARADGIRVPENTTLTMEGSGTLSVYSGGSFVAIGNSEGATGDITIENGTVNAYVYGTETHAGGIGIGGILNSQSTTTSGGNITIKGGKVTAYGGKAGIGYYDTSSNMHEKSGVPMNYNITINGGTVNAYGFPYNENVNPDEVSDTYLSSVGIGGHAVGEPGERNILIAGGTVTAYGSYAAIGGDFDNSNKGASDKYLNIKLTGGDITAKAIGGVKGVGIGGKMRGTDHRTIEISGDAVVKALARTDKTAPIGGGDNSNGTIVIKGNAEVNAASVIGSTGYDDENGDGYDGGNISILENASIYKNGGWLENVEYVGGSTGRYGANGGNGGDIIINTTGTVRVDAIGGGDGANGGDGGNITIENGELFVKHIGGGNGLGYDSNTPTGVGGNGGNITISGGIIGESDSESPVGGISEPEGSGVNRYYYSAAGIGGGGGTKIGGNGGTINITDGKVRVRAGVTVYDASTGEKATSGKGVGGAGIGGGNGADGGVINISGGTVLAVYAKTSDPKPTSADELPALIGGGSAGGAGEITISGGLVEAYVFVQNVPVYGVDSINLGQGKGATDAGGFVKITGGGVELDGSQSEPHASPAPWPTAEDGSTEVYPARLELSYAEGIPENVEVYDASITSMTIRKKSDGSTYSYGASGVEGGQQIWLPISEDFNTWDQGHNLYDITLTAKKDNTNYSFEGTVYYEKNSNYMRGLSGYTNLTYKGESIQSLQITSDWGMLVKAYNGADQKPNFTVKNAQGATLTEGDDYTLKIEYKPNNGSGVKAETTEFKNAGGYNVTATGVSGTAYDGMTATLEQLWINPKHITAVYNGEGYTKEYDGNTAVFNGTTLVESFPVEINPADVCAGDELTNIIATNPRYTASGVGNDIVIIGNSPSYTYKQNGQLCDVFNYSVELPTNLKGNITAKTVGPTNLDPSGVTVSKVYDGTTNCTLANVKGSVSLKDLVGTDVATVDITAVSAFDNKDVGTHTVTATLGNLAGANGGNYVLAGGVSTVGIANATITPADSTYNLTAAQQRQELSQGGNLSQIILPQTANGVNGETVTGTVTLWHDEACTANQASDSSVGGLSVGSHNLYAKFVPSATETNYTNKVTTGKVVVLTVVEGNPQEVSFATTGVINKAYGDESFANQAVNASADGGIISYTSSQPSVATVNSATGQVMIKGAGTATITATAAKVEGKYRATSVAYDVTVSKKGISISVDDKTKKYGDENPSFTFTHNPSDLVLGDTVGDLAVSLSCEAKRNSPAGTGVAITATSTSKNYNVTIEPGILTIEKAGKPFVENINKSLLYSKANNDVVVDIVGLPTDKGTTSFSAGLVSDTDGIINGTVTNTATGIKFSTNMGNVNQTAIIPVTVTMGNYESTTVTVTITLVDKTPVTITGVSVGNKVYDGVAASHKGTPVNEQGYIGTYDYIWSGGNAPKDAGSYMLTVKVPESNMEFTGELRLPFTIEQKALTVKPNDITIKKGAQLPTAFTLQYVGLVGGDTITPIGTPEFGLKNGSAILVDSNTTGNFVIAWTNKDAVTIENQNYDVTKGDGTLVIKKKSSSSDDSGSTSGGGGSAVKNPEKPVSTGNGTATIEATTKNNGKTSTAVVDKDALDSAIKAAKEDATKNKTKASVEIHAKTSAEAKEAEFSIPKTGLDTFVESKSETLSLTSGIGEISMDAQAVESIAKQAAGSDVVMSVAKVDATKELNSQQQQAVGNAPVYDISIQSGGQNITQFDGERVTITLPYQLKDGEDPSNVVVWYVDSKGNIQKVESSYDVKKKVVVFHTKHLSLYAVGYQQPDNQPNPSGSQFADVTKADWYYEAVEYVQQKGMLSGTSDSMFSPNVTTTRGMLFTILYRLEGSPETKMKDFTDVSPEDWYAKAVSWAAESGIASGYGDGKIGAEDPITREQMVVMLRNYGKFKGYDTTAEGSSLSSFRDGKSVSPWASDALAWAVSQNLVTGDTESNIQPNGSATRGQVAAILMRFCKYYVK